MREMTELRKLQLLELNLLLEFRQICEKRIDLVLRANLVKSLES